MSPWRALVTLFSALLLSWASLGARADDGITVYRIKPSETDPAIVSFNNPNYVVFQKDAEALPELVVFLPGTGGRPEHNKLLMDIIARQGYRVIGLQYDDEPSVSSLCPKDPDPDCSAKFREERISGAVDGGPVSNPPVEAIVNRLTRLLQCLDRRHPDEDWSRYLDNGAPAWERIVISGRSQGAGMAAFIAKQHAVARVVLFSSPWDDYGLDHSVAPWISEKSATPAELWFAAYHAREKTHRLIAAAYAALPILPANLRVFNSDLALNEDPSANNPFHKSVTTNPAYVPQWRFLYGILR